MKTALSLSLPLSLRAANYFCPRLFLALLAVLLAGVARAGFTLEMDVIRYAPGNYYFSPNLNTNSTPPSVPFGDYYIASYDSPTNGANALYRFDTNGFNQIGGGSWGFGDFASMLHELTNGTWFLFVTNTAVTNGYAFPVAANLVSNDLPVVAITFPTDGATAVTNQPVYVWQGPTNYSDLVVYAPNSSPYLPVTQTSWPSPAPLYEGANSFTVHYDYYSTTSVIAAVPQDGGGHPVSSWVSTTHLQDSITSQFSVGTVDTAGTVHTLVAHYPFDAPSGPVLAAAIDTSTNGFDLTFSGGYGSEGGANLSADAAAGAGAVQFHDGDGNSAGYLGWSQPTPPGLLAALAGSFTVSCWIKTTQDNFGYDQAPAYQGAGIVAADNSGLANDVIPIALTGTTIGFNTGGSTGEVTLNSTASVNDGHYHHIVVTRNQSTGQKIIYVDGTFDSFSSGTTNLLTDPQKLTIGALADASNPNPNDGSYYNGYDGELDDLQIYSGVLSAAEVSSLYFNPGTTITNGGGYSGYAGGHTNIAHYAFDNNNYLGQDTSGNGNNLDGESWWGPQQQFSTTAEAGGGAVQFFGTSCLTPDGSALANWDAVLGGSFTISAWVNTTAAVGNDGDDAIDGATLVWAYDDHDNTNDTIPIALTGSKAAFFTRDHLGNSSTLHSTTSVNDGLYHLITVTRDQNSGLKMIYVDGNLEGSQASTTEPLNGNNYFLSVGGTVYSSYTGLADDLQIYSGVLNAAEVAYLYAHPGQAVSNTIAGGAADFNPALGTTNLAWSSSGDTAWFAETTNTYNGAASAAQSGSVVGSQTSTLSVTVTGPGTLTFGWSSIANDPNGQFDYEFDLDGNYQDNLTGDNGWYQDGPFAIGAGPHTLSWTVSANGDTDPTQAGFLGAVSFLQQTVPVITLNPFNQTNYPGYNVALLAAATSNPTATWQWFQAGNAAPIANATNALYIPASSGTAGVAGGYFAVASNPAGVVNTATATVTFASAALPPDWKIAFRSPLANNTTDPTTNYNIACTLDSTGNVYSVGSIIGTNTFGSDALISIDGNSGASILKQTPTGTAIWGCCLTNNGSGSSFAQCVALAPGDGCYVSGDFFGTNWLGTNRLVDIAGGSTFLARFDASGNNLWVRTITGTNGNFTEYHRLFADAAGNVTLSTLASGTTSLGSTNVTVNGQSGLLVQYDAAGNVRWLELPSGWPCYLTGQGGCIYGSMGGSSINYIGGATNYSDRNEALFAINATNGQGYWVQGIGSQMGQGNPGGLGDQDPVVAVTGTNLFVAGNGWGSNAAFGPYTATFPTSKGQYFARYDVNGNAQLATAFGSQYVWPWAIAADAQGDVYIGGDFDTYAIFGQDIIAAPFYATVQYVGTIANRIPGQGFVAKFDRNGNALWARPAVSQSSYLNNRDIALAPDGIWCCGLFNQTATLANLSIDGGITINGSPLGVLVYHPSGFLGKVIESKAVGLVNPLAAAGNFQFTFLSQPGVTHTVEYRTNLNSGAGWQIYSNVPGDGTVKTIPVPASVFSPARQGFIRVSSQ